MEDNVSWPPCSNNRFCIWKHLLNHIWVTEALSRPQKPPNMVIYHGKFSQSYIQYPVWAQAYVRSRLSLVLMYVCLYFFTWYFVYQQAVHCCLWLVPELPWSFLSNRTSSSWLSGGKTDMKTIQKFISHTEDDYLLTKYKLLVTRTSWPFKVFPVVSDMRPDLGQ